MLPQHKILTTMNFFWFVDSIFAILYILLECCYTDSWVFQETYQINVNEKCLFLFAYFIFNIQNRKWRFYSFWLHHSMHDIYYLETWKIHTIYNFYPKQIIAVSPVIFFYPILMLV